MRVQKLALAVGLVSALGGNAALALGLGEIKLNSTLNQPLNAEIKLLQTRGLGDSEIKVRLASPEDFERAGVDRSYLLTELHFDVDYSSGQPVVRISTRSPIREPFLNFVVETRWPSGRLLREYTLLMDLPAFSTNTASQPVRAAERERQQVRREAPVQQPLRPAVQQPQPQEQRTPEPVQAPAEEVADIFDEPQQVEAQEPAATQEPANLYSEPQAAVADTSVDSSGSRVYGPVASNQTLWEIARDSRDSRELSVQQTMLAIQRLNPEAFINDNINLLKKGAVLRLPSSDEVRALSLSDAVAQVASQNENWRAGSIDESSLGAPLDGRAVVQDSVEVETVEGRVTLAAPGDNESVLSGSGSGAEDSEALAGELAVNEEELDKSQLENAELQERIGELDEQIDTMEALVEVSNEELRAVQAAAGQTEEALADTEAAEVLAAEEFATNESAAELSDQNATEIDPVAEEPAEEDTADDARNRVVFAAPAKQPSLMDQVMDNIQLVGIGAGVLLVGLFGFFTWRRRKEEEEAILQVEAEMAAERALAEAPEMTETEDPLNTVEEMEADVSFDLDQFGELETGDPVAEAGIHLSLAQYDEAEAKLLTGLGNAPQNVDARLMLLEVYAQQQNADKFDDHYRQLLEVSDGPAADRAARLRSTIVGAGEFVAPAMDFSSESLEAAQLDDMGGDFDSELSFPEQPDFAQRDNSNSNDLESGLLDDFDLNLDEPESELSTGDDDFSLSLDFDDDLDGGSNSDLGAEQQTAEQDEFNLDDLMSGGELDLDSLDLGLEDEPQLNAEPEAASSLESDSFSLQESATAESTPVAEDESGLDFDLNLSPMESEVSEEDADNAALNESVALSTEELDDFGSFGDDLDGLDLDSIDLGEFESLDDIGSELADSDTAVATATPVKSSVQPAASSAPGPQESDLSDLSFNLESDLDSELNLMEGSDEVSTKLELAQAYLEMGDKDGAREILGEVVEEATGERQQRAKEMLGRMV